MASHVSVSTFERLIPRLPAIDMHFPKQDMIFAALVGAIYFIILDADRGYHQFGFTLLSKSFTAFTTDFGIFEFKRVPFGLKTAPAHFQQAIDIILGTMHWDFALTYIGDTIVYSTTLEEHISHVTAVLKTLSKAGMTHADAKCQFGYQDNCSVIECLTIHIGSESSSHSRNILPGDAK
jgi:Reverse transcriptase (RNA-dependent DNA polymerase)